MTRLKDLKRRIRERMARTGERYTTARSHVIDVGPTEAWRRGEHAETTLLGRLLDRAGVADPRTGEPLSEAFLLGVGGGLGGAYFTFRYEGAAPTLYIGTRIGHQVPYDAGFSTGALERLGIPLRMDETGGAKTAAAHLDAVLSEGVPALAWVDDASLPWSALKAEYRGHMPRLVLVVGAAGDAVEVLDHGARVRSLSRPELDAARGRYKKAKHRLIRLGPVTPPTEARLTHAAREGVRACVQSLRDGALVDGFAGNFGLSALRTWAKRIRSKAKNGWERLFFGNDAHAFVALTETYRWIEAAGTGGGGFRRLFADFLAQSATLVPDPDAWTDAAEIYRTLGDAWRTLAVRALDPDVPALAEAQRQLDARAAHVALGDDGASAAADVALEGLAARVAAEGLGLDDPTKAATLEALGDHLEELVDLEEQAVDVLEALVAP